MWANPPNSPTIVGNAVATIVESSAAKSMTSSSPPKTTSTLSCEVRDVSSTGAAASIAIELRVVLHFQHAGHARAIGTTVKRFPGLDTVADDLATTVVADRRELVNRAFEAVKRVTRAGGDDFERHMIVVAAHFAFCHLKVSFSRRSFALFVPRGRGVKTSFCSLGLSQITTTPRTNWYRKMFHTKAQRKNLVPLCETSFCTN